MNDPIAIYFDGEKQAGMICIPLAIAALAFAFWVWRGNPQFRAMAIPLALFGVVGLAIGGVLLGRTDKQVATLRADLAADHATARGAEIKRMERVNTNFKWLEVVWIVLIAAGVVLTMFLRSRPTVMAVGMGMLLLGTVMLLFDVFAEARAHIYTAWLRGG